MIAQADEMKNAFILKNKNSLHEVIIENNKNGYYMAHTKNFILCYISSNEVLEPNTLCTIKITEAFEDGAKAEIVKM